jgi:hypothetical protein
MTFQCRDQTPRHGPETHSSKPIGYPFNLKAAASILFVAEESNAPVFCGLAIGADAPKFLLSI